MDDKMALIPLEQQQLVKKVSHQIALTDRLLSYDIKFLEPKKIILQCETENGEIKFFEVDSNISKLDLSNNGITTLPIEIRELQNLIYLNLRSNKLSDLSPLIPLKKLNELNLASNCISDLTFISFLTELTLLKLERNQIYDIKPLTYLKKLLKLSIETNNISDPFELLTLNNLELLSIFDNPLRKITVEELIESMPNTKIFATWKTVF